MNFQVVSDYHPKGDQPQAIEKLVANLEDGAKYQTLLGATGTGKTKSLQILAEQMSMQGIPSLLMDLKGDLSGLAQPGETNKHIEKRALAIGEPYRPIKLLVELF